MSQPQTAPTRWLEIARYVGPGLILTASIVGSGELIVTPKLAGEVGFKMLWLIVLGCMIKVFVQIELGRFAMARGMTTLEAMNTIPGPRFIVSWLLWIWLGMYLAIVFQVAGIVGGIADTLATGGVQLNRNLIAALVAASCAVPLAFGRYRLIEGFSTVLVVVFTVTTVIAVGALQWTDYAITPQNLADGFKFQLPEKFTTAFGALGIIGVGASELIYYPYWCLEKGYARFVGPNDGSPEWIERAKGWMRVMRFDAWVSMVVYTLATAAFFLLGAAVLYAKGLKVTDKGMIDTLAHMYKSSFGNWSFYLFLVGAFAVLYSTAFVATASNARLLADALSIFKVVKYKDASAREYSIRLCCVVLPIVSLIMFIAWPKPVQLVFVGAVGQGIMLPFLSGAALYFRYKQTPAGLAPNKVWDCFLWVAAISMASAGVYMAWEEISKKL
ncbi:MAG: Nramp family divalent metal transporter [Verrucomicrobiota bacterium]